MGAKGVSTSMTPVVYRKTKIPVKRSLAGRRTGGMNYPEGQTWHKSDKYFTEQNKQWTKNMHGINACNLEWSGGNLCKLPFGKPDWKYQ